MYFYLLMPGDLAVCCKYVFITTLSLGIYIIIQEITGDLSLSRIVCQGILTRVVRKEKLP